MTDLLWFSSNFHEGAIHTSPRKWGGALAENWKGRCTLPQPNTATAYAAYRGIIDDRAVIHAKWVN